MINLLSATMPRAFKTKRFIFSLLIMIAIPSLIMYVSALLDDELYMDSFPFFMNTFMPMIISIIGGLFISKDYTNNTIRNKIIVGHSRQSIYMANWITSVVITLTLFAIYLLFIFAVGVTIFSFSAAFEFGYFIKILLLTLCPLIAFVSITVFICMTVKGTSGTVLSFMFYYSLMIFSSFSDLIQNKDIVNLIHNILITDQLAILQESTYEDLVPDFANFTLYPISSLIVILASTLGGIAIFRKTDIK
jgi:hypothetical protein